MKFKSLVIFLLLILLRLITFSQGVEVKVSVLQAFSPQAKLLRYTADQLVLVDSSKQIAQGEYRFQLPEGYKKGLYKIEVGKNINFNIIINNEPEIDVNTIVFAPEDSLKSEHSAENMLYWHYQKIKKRYGQHIWYICSLKDYYADSSAFLKTLTEEELRLQRELFTVASQMVVTNPNLLASSFILLEQRPVTEPTSSSLAQTWWGGIDLQDPAIINSPSFRERLWAYMELFFSENFDKEQQDLAFIKGIHQLMLIPMCLEIQKPLREMLIAGFVDSDYLDVLDYLYYTTFGGLKPLKQNPKESHKDLPKIRVGDKAYNFTFYTDKGQSLTLAKVDAAYKLVFFWSSWCPVCIDDIPQIKRIYNEYRDKGFEVIAISLDDEPMVWKRYVNDIGLEWINVREPYSPDNEIYKMYNVHETPRMFLLSADLKIVSKPSTIRQLEARLKRILR